MRHVARLAASVSRVKLSLILADDESPSVRDGKWRVDFDLLVGHRFEIAVGKLVDVQASVAGDALKVSDVLAQVGDGEISQVGIHGIGNLADDEVLQHHHSVFFVRVILGAA